MVAPLPQTALVAASVAAVLPLAVLALSRGGSLGRSAGGSLLVAYLVFVVATLG